MHTITSSKKSQRISRYSNVNIAMLNSMRTSDTQQGEELENTLSKQTKLEQRVSMLTIKRTMACFFAIIFSVPFFISSTYKGYLSEFEPIAKMANEVKTGATMQEYLIVLQTIVDNHKNDYDKLVGLEADPYFSFKTPEYANDEIRSIDLRKLTAYDITFTVNLHNTIELYAICGICGY